MVTYDVIFFTATILNWQKALAYDGCKQIIVDSLHYLTSHDKAQVYAFVIMPNHIHLLWQNAEYYPYKSLQRDFLKFTAQQIKFFLIKNNPDFLSSFLSTQTDRVFQIWERRSKSIFIQHRDIAFQKLNYIHHNPVQPQWRLVNDYQQYPYSSVRYYECGENDFPFLTHYMDGI